VTEILQRHSRRSDRSTLCLYCGRVWPCPDYRDAKVELSAHDDAFEDGVAKAAKAVHDAMTDGRVRMPRDLIDENQIRWPTRRNRGLNDEGEEQA
jgi:hypothetical protein